MKAIRFHEYGGPEVLVLEDALVPNVGPGQVLVKVHAAAVNPADFKFRGGWFKDHVPLPLPFIPGADFSGTVESVGPLVTRFKPGDAVFGMRDVQVGGSYAEYVAVDGDALAHKPSNLSHYEAAAVPLAALTAWSALFDHAHIEAGQSILIHAAAGGVGSFAVQLAKSVGARVIATASGDNIEVVRALGADEVIDYRSTDFTRVVSNIDAVLDAFGGESQRKSFGVLRKGGVLVTLQPPGVDESMARLHGIRAALVEVSAYGARTAELASLLQGGRLKVLIDQVFPLAEAGLAHARSETGHARGKLVIAIA